MSENEINDATIDAANKADAKADAKANAKKEKKAAKAKAAKKPAAKKPAAKKAPAKRKPTEGPWQEILTKAAEQFGKAGSLAERTTKEKKKAGLLLWDGAQAAINDWDSANDPSAEVLSNAVKEVLGESRKGDVSKIKTVALAVAHKNLDMSEYVNLSRAYAAAKALSGEVDAKHKAEDDAADEAIAKMEAPAKTSTPEGAALLVLAKGPDEAARLLLDALGADNTLAHRSLVRAITSEAGGRVKPEPKVTVKKTAPKEGAEIADPKAAPAKAAPVEAKAKPVATTKAAPAKATAKAAPTTKAAPVKATATKAAPVKAVAKPVARRA